MSDFYIFLEEDKNFTYEEIKNLSIDEMNKYLKEYIKLEKGERKMENKTIKDLINFIKTANVPYDAELKLINDKEGNPHLTFNKEIINEENEEYINKNTETFIFC